MKDQAKDDKNPKFQKGLFQSGSAWQLITLFGIITLLLIIAGVWFYDEQSQNIRTNIYVDLESIAELKVGQIVQWRLERLGDAQLNSKSPLMRSAITQWLKTPGDFTLKANILSTLQLIKLEYSYQNVILTDSDGQLLLSSNSNIVNLDDNEKQLAVQTINFGVPQFGDFYRTPTLDRVFLDISAPILDDKNKTVAVLILQVDPENYLYPLIQSWPTPSRSAETLLVRKDGVDALFLNTLRHDPASPLTLRIPLNNADVPAVQAISGKAGLYEGHDYRGVDVLSDIIPIPGTPWFMIAKVDTDEILAEVHELGLAVMLFVVLSVLMTAVLAYLIFNNRQRILYENLYQAESKRREAQEETRTTLYSIGDGVITTDQFGNITRLNPVAERLTGWDETEAKGKPLAEVFRIINELMRNKVENPVTRVLREGLVVGLANHTLLIARDNTERPIADSGAPIRDENGDISGVVLVFRDQTEERAAQRELALLSYVIDHSLNEITLFDAESLKFRYVNKGGLRNLGYSLDQLLTMSPLDIKPDFTPESFHHLIQPLLEHKEEALAIETLHRRVDGSVYPVEVCMQLFEYEQERVFLSVIQDISVRKQSEEALRKSEESYRKLIEESHELIFTHDLELNIVSMNPAMQKLLEITADSVKGLNFNNLVSINEKEEIAPYIQTVSRDGIKSGQWRILTKKNDERILEYQSTIIDQEAQTTVVRFMAQDITDKIHREQELEAIAALSSALRSLAPKQQLFPIILQELNKLVKVDGSAISWIDEGNRMVSVESGFGEWRSWTGITQPLGQGVFTAVFEMNQLFVDEKAAYRKVSDWPGPLGNIQTVVCLPLIANSQAIGVLWLGRKEMFSKGDLRILITLSDISASAIRNADLYKQVEDKVATLASLYDAGLALNSLLEPYEQLEFLLHIALDELKAERMVFLRYIPANSCYVADLCLGFHEELQAAIYQKRYPSPETQGSSSWINMDSLPLYNPDIAGNTNLSLGDSEMHSVLWVPIQHGNNIRGILGAMSSKINAFNPNQERLLVLFANQAAVAMEQASLLSETKLQLQRLKSLRQIDETINTSLDLTTTSSVLLEQITIQLNVDAAALLIANPKSNRLEYFNRRGFNTSKSNYTDFLFEQDLAGRSVSERQIVHLAEQDIQNIGSPFIKEQQFVEYYGVPLFSKGALIGVLEIFNRSTLTIDESWLDFMGTLAGQAAIAIDDISLFENLQRSNTELTLAYDATIEGWSQAMDLRDKETEGHTRRVTEMTLQLSKALGLPEEDLVHIRRGSLLHDIGKLGVPDQILFKAGPLDENEWIVMKKHPEYAYQMLSSIEYLKPALDIPYCHHEKWDGSGYPRGLKGEDIPLAARIFAIIDTWDALTSDRPYRPAWTKEISFAYISEQNGIQFDPKVVEAFEGFLSNPS